MDKTTKLNQENFSRVYASQNPYYGNFGSNTQKWLLRNLDFEDKRVLDFGFGSGEVLAWMESQGAKCSGVELVIIASKQLYAKQEIYGIVEPDLAFGDYHRKLPYLENYFDYVISFHTVEHVKDDKKLMREFYRVLKPGGLVILGLPTEHEGKDGWKDSLHYREYDWDTARDLLMVAGFTPIQFQGYDGRLNKFMGSFLHESLPGLFKAKASNSITKKKSKGVFRDSFKAKFHRRFINSFTPVNYFDWFGQQGSIFIVGQKP